MRTGPRCCSSSRPPVRDRLREGSPGPGVPDAAGRENPGDAPDCRESGQRCRVARRPPQGRAYPVPSYPALPARAGRRRSVQGVVRIKQIAEAGGLQAQFLVWNALDLPGLSRMFDTVIDSGFFHVLSDEDRSRSAESLKAVLAPGGKYFMLCFSDRNPGEYPLPRRIAQKESGRPSGRGGPSTASSRRSSRTPFSPKGTMPGSRRYQGQGWDETGSVLPGNSAPNRSPSALSLRFRSTSA